MAASNPCFLSVADAAALIAAKRLSPVELVQAYLARIERLNDALHAYVRVLPDEALAAARAAEAEIAAGHYRGPLHGIPIGLKDILRHSGSGDRGRFETVSRARPRRRCDDRPALETGRRHSARQADDLGVRDRRHRLRYDVSAGPQPMEM